MNIMNTSLVDDNKGVIAIKGIKVLHKTVRGVGSKSKARKGEGG